MPTALPASTDFTGAAVTEAQFKTALSNMRTFLSDLLGTDGLSATALTALGAILNATLSKSAAYTVVAADKGKLIDYTTGTYTLSLTAAATLGAGFSFAVRNSGAGVITIDPNGTELIDGAATITLAADESCFVLCSGTTFKTVSKSAALTSAAIIAALGYTPSIGTTLGTTWASTSGTSHTWTGIPAGVTEVTVNFKGVSASVNSTTMLVRIGDSGGIESTSYTGFDATGFFACVLAASSRVYAGSMVLRLLDASSNTWIARFYGFDESTYGELTASTSAHTLTTALTQIQVLVTANAFDAGSINISYK